MDLWWAGCSLAECIDSVAMPDPFDTVKLQVLVMGYHHRWADMQPSLGIEDIEVVKTFPIRNPETGRISRTWRGLAKLDKVYAGHIVEHKTTSQDIGPGATYWQQLAIDDQCSYYWDAVDFELEGVIYDVVHKPGLKPLKCTPPDKRRYTAKGHLYANQRDVDETPDEYMARLTTHVATNPDLYYARVTIVRLEEELIEAREDIWWTAKDLHRCKTRGKFPKNPGSCMKWNRLCDYFEVCSKRADINDDLRFRSAASKHEEYSAEELACLTTE
jgi:hypothetical protein